MRGMNRDPKSLLEDPTFVETTNDLLKALEHAAPVADEASTTAEKPSPEGLGYNPYDVGTAKLKIKPKRTE
jgi:hypothetical protein